MKKRLVFALGFLAIQAITFSSFAGDEVPIKDFTLPSASDATLIHLSDFHGKVVLINYWRTVCAYSQDEAPKLVELYRKYHDQGLEILGVSADHPDTIKNLGPYLKRYGIGWPIALNDQGEFMREVFKLPRPYTPTNYLVTRSGKMISLGRDWDDSIRKIEAPIIKALAEPVLPGPTIAPRVTESAPRFELPDLQGKTIRSVDLIGKPTIVAFFDNDTCDRSGKELSALNDQYGPKGLQVIGIDSFDPPKTIKQCADKYAMHFPLLRGNHEVQQAYLRGARHWGIFFIDRRGDVMKEVVNWEDDDLEHWTWPKYVEYLLGEPELEKKT
jgi:peroxiredoxin